MAESDELIQARGALYDALQAWVNVHDKPDQETPPLLTKAVIIMEIQEPHRKNRTLAFRTVDLNLGGLYSWDILGMLASCTDATREAAAETRYDPEDPPPGDLGEE